MARKILVCVTCRPAAAILKKSVANQAPKWTGEVGDQARQEIGGQDDLKGFRQDHRGHEIITANLG